MKNGPHGHVMPHPARQALKVTGSVCLLMLFTTRVDAQLANPPDPIRWEAGPCVASIAGVARLDVPAGYRWAGREAARRLMESLGNPNSNPSGALLFEAADAPFLLVFRFLADGYVPDDEKDRLDPDVLLGAIRDATERDNAIRRERDWPAIDEAEWEAPPSYDPRTNDLTWAVRFKCSGQPGVNHDTRRLGRSGIMQVKLITTPDLMATIVPTLDAILKGFSFDLGKQYKDHVAGDRVAPYGLAALVGGASATYSAGKGWLGSPRRSWGGAAPNGPSRAPHPAPIPSAGPSAFASPGASTRRTRPLWPVPGEGLGSLTRRPVPGVGVPLGISPAPAFGGRAFPQPATGEYHVPPSLRPRPTRISGTIDGKEASGLGKGLFAAIGAAILGAFSWMKKQLGGNRRGSSGPA